MREVTAIEPKWLTEAAPTFYKVADANKISKRKRQEKIEVCTLGWVAVRS
jgi:ATP-dependent RNA helicase DHX8/PRP22